MTGNQVTAKVCCVLFSQLVLFDFKDGLFNIFCSYVNFVHVLSGLIQPCQVLVMVLVFWRWKCFKCLFYEA